MDNLKSLINQLRSLVDNFEEVLSELRKDKRELLKEIETPEKTKYSSLHQD